MRVFVVMISLLSVVISQKNLAPNGTVSQSTTYYHVSSNINLTADLAISGGPTDTLKGCSITWYTPFQRFAWWMLTFPVDTVYITNVKIYYRPNYERRLAGYYLYVSNSSTTKTDGHLCYHDTGSNSPSAYQNVNCNHLGKHVIFYNERMITTNNPLGINNHAIVELCYIEVNGCYKGWWDSNCTTPCPVNCIGNHCFPGNGRCIWGCKIGLRGDHCDTPCVPGTFGNQCSGNCHCVNQPCDPVDGTCSAGGCQPGYKGNTCSTACSSGKFGNQCSSICHCVNQPCNPIIGTCPAGGCQRGYKGTTCSIACVSGTFENNCASICHCVNQPCNHEHGTCPAGGCQRGYEGITCSTECSFSNFGYNCSQPCDGCLSDACESTYGYCINQSGCKPGWKYDQPGQVKCAIECGSGTFGNNCSSNCHCVNQPCDPEHGTCPAGGCQRGYKGSICSIECDLGNYGYNCDQSCDGCLSESCDKESGVCTNTTGCKLGWQYGQELKCDKKCVSGTFGDQCSKSCHCVSQPCDLQNGTCPDGGCESGYNGNTCSIECSHGYYGYNCNESCDGCLVDSCERENGVCTDKSGCKPRRQLGQMKKCECVSGTFGNNCSKNCHCVNQPCDPKHGTCPAGGCQRGYKGITCSTECILGHYGYNCEESCDGCLLNSCDREYGVCTDTTACKHGRQPGELMKCDKACGSGTFGNQCSSNCHCFNQPCDPEDGTCPAGGCERGYEGITCSTECASGDYGYNCEYHCRICVNSSCERYEGLCTYGCIDGLKGLQCQSAATPQSDGQNTKDNTMNVTYAVIGTFIGTTLGCAIIVLAILRYRKHKKDGYTKEQGGQKPRGFNNDAFTNDIVNTVANNTDTHYEDTIHSDQEQDETYDTI